MTYSYLELKLTTKATRRVGFFQERKTRIKFSFLSIASTTGKKWREKKEQHERETNQVPNIHLFFHSTINFTIFFILYSFSEFYFVTFIISSLMAFIWLKIFLAFPILQSNLLTIKFSCLKMKFVVHEKYEKYSIVGCNCICFLLFLGA